MGTRLASRIDAVDSFGDVVRHHDRALRALAFRLLGDADLMDDALQDAYAKAFRAYGGFRGDSEVGTWLYRIVYNACVDVRRVATRHRHDDLSARPLPAVEDDLETVAPFGDLAAALAALPDDQRAVVLLVDADGFDYTAAAEILGVPVGTVASRLSRARAALRRDYGEGTG